MPRKRSIPSMRYHISGQAVVTFTVNGGQKNFYLGEHGSPEAQARYDTLVAKYLANGRNLPEEETHQADDKITVANVMAEYRRLIDLRPKQLERYRHLCTTVEDEYGDDPADKFGPRKLAEIRDLFVASKITRPTINEYVHRIVLMFRHAVSRELIDVSVLIRLQSLEPLKQGQTTAKEFKKRQPADIADVRAAAKHLSRPARAIIILQAATAMRPSEIFNMRPCDIDRSGAEWFYRVLSKNSSDVKRQ